MEKTLEHEFAVFARMHKLKVIATALVIYENEGMYSGKPLGDYDLSYLTGIAKANYVIRDLLRRGIYDEEESHYFDKVYDICWKKIPPMFKDNVNCLMDMILLEK